LGGQIKEKGEKQGGLRYKDASTLQHKNERHAFWSPRADKKGRIEEKLIFEGVREKGREMGEKTGASILSVLLRKGGE